MSTVRTGAVAVVLPTHNRPSLLARALGSLVAQARPPDEVIVINDGGVDVSEIVRSFREQLLPVKLIEHPCNKGRSAAYNTGLSHVKSELTAFLNDDDVYLPEHLDISVSALQQLGSGHAVYTEARQIVEDSAGRELGSQILGACAFDPSLLQVTNYISAINTVVPTETLRVLGGFDTSLDVLEDWDLWIRVSLNLEWVHVPAVTTEYRLRTDRTNSTTREFFRFHPALQQIYAKYPLADNSPLLKDRLAMLEGSRLRVDSYGFEYTLAIAGRLGDAPAQATLESALASLRDMDLEICLFASDSSTLESIQTPHPVQMYRVGEVPLDEIWRLAARRAAGRRLLLLRTGEIVDEQLLRRARHGRPGGARRIGRAGPHHKAASVPLLQSDGQAAWA